MSANPSEENNKAVFWLPVRGVVPVAGLETVNLQSNVPVDTHFNISWLRESEGITMKDLLKKIYNDVLVYESDVVKINLQVDEEINQLVEPYTKQLSDEETEKLKEMLSIVGLTAEQAGFENGVRFAVKLLYSLLKWLKQVNHL